MKNVLFLSGLFPNEIRKEIIDNSKYNTQFAADSLQWSMVNGLSFYYDNLKILNVPFIGAYPFLYKKISTKEFAFNTETITDAFNLSFVNLIGFKNFHIYKKVKSNIINWAKGVQGEKVIVIYSAYLPFLSAAIAAKKANNDIKICLILPDLPNDLNNFKNLLYKYYIKYNRDKINECFDSVDLFVLLSKHMAEELPIKNIAWTVVEGIYDQSGEKKQINNFEVSNNSERIILYTGTLHVKYGILNLIEAFKLLKDESLRLVIYGGGDAEDKVKMAQIEDNRISYKGTIDRKELLSVQRKATLLVNPRTGEGKFTKFSFPSKTMEYFASGVPTLLYKLEGIPEEYYEHCFYLEKNSILDLTDKIENILKLPPSALKRIGDGAKKFVLEHKNPLVQCEKIYKLIENN